MHRLLAPGMLLVATFTVGAAQAQGDMCAEQSIVIEVDARPAEMPPSDDGRGIPWCATPDDPRCNRGDEVPGVPSVVGPTPVAGIGVTAVQPAPTGDVRAFPPAERSGLRPGFTDRVERPPR